MTCAVTHPVSTYSLTALSYIHTSGSLCTRKLDAPSCFVLQSTRCQHACVLLSYRGSKQLLCNQRVHFLQSRAWELREWPKALLTVHGYTRKLLAAGPSSHMQVAVPHYTVLNIYNVCSYASGACVVPKSPGGWTAAAPPPSPAVFGSRTAVACLHSR